MMRLLLPSILLLLGVCRAKEGDNKNVTKPFVSSRVEVHIPFDLHDPEGFDHVQAEYGFDHNMHGSISAFVYYVDGFMCDPLELHKMSEAAKIPNSTEIFPSIYPPRPVNEIAHLTPPFILMARSDHCSPVTKARNAQAIGASAFIMAYEHCLCNDKACTDKFGPKCFDHTPELVSDGSAADVSIPSFLLYKVNSMDIFDKMSKHNQTVLMELSWGRRDIYNPEKGGEEAPYKGARWHFYTTAHDPLMDLRTMKELKAISSHFYHKEEKKALFSPRFSLMDGSRFECDKQVDVGGPCDQLCTNRGRYCAVHTKNLTGAKIIEETLRRLCIWKHFGDIEGEKKEKADPDIYWKYVIEFLGHCHAANLFTDEKCIEEAMEMAGMKGQASVINQCMKDSGGLADDVPNSLLQDQLEHQKNSGIVQIPAVTMNRQRIGNVPSGPGLFESICEFYWDIHPGDYPEICSICTGCHDLKECLENGKCVAVKHSKHEQPYGNSKKKGGHHFFWTMFFLMLIGGGGYFVYMKRQENEFGISDRQGLLNGYFQMGGEN